jgi:multicomponent Na+:H+ antiporter subunit A
MTTLVLFGFGLGLLAPLLCRIARGWTGWLLAAYPAAAFLLLLVGELEPEQQLAWGTSLGLELSFALDGLSRLFALLITGVGAFVLIYAGAYMRGRPHLGRFFASLVGFMAAMLGLVLADNVLLLFVFWELTSITSFLLIGFEHERSAARAAALQALYVTAGGGLALLAGLLLLADAGGSSSLRSLALTGATIRGDGLYAPLLLLVLVGAFTKSAQVPFHFWLPNAMEAPTPVSAYLHSSTMVKAGVYLLARLHPALGGTTLWMTLVGGVGAATAVTAAVLAWRQTDLKRILAYSTVSALGMMTMLLGLGGDLALRAAVLLILAHALYKGALFMVAGTIAHESGERNLSRLAGLGRSMPLTGTAAALAALSMAGVPPFGGYLAKELMLEAALHTPVIGALAAGVLVMSVLLLGAVAFLVGFRPFRGAPVNAARVHDGAPGLWLGALVLAVTGATVGIVPILFADSLVHEAAGAIGASPGGAPTLALWHGVTAPLLLGAGAILGAWLLARTWSAPAEERPAAGAAERAYLSALRTLTGVATRQTRAIQSGYLRYYLLVTIGVAALLAGGTLVVFGVPPLGRGSRSVAAHEAFLLLLVVASALGAARSRSRLGSVAALGIVGYCVALIYVIHGAPDLAMTQFVIETLTVILFLFAFRGLPAATFRTGRRTHLRDGTVAAATGLLMTVLVIVATSAQHAPPTSGYFLENSVDAAHGRNVVNVILVDFRALDTLGEISVLALAGIGVYALLRLQTGDEAVPR